MASEQFESIAFFPNGDIYDSGNWNISEMLDHAPYSLLQFQSVDSTKRSNKIDAPIGELELVWSASSIFGVSTLLKDGVTINTAVFLPGKNLKEEQELLSYYLSAWRNMDVVKQLMKGETPFAEVKSLQSRPLMVSVNWATISKEQYDSISYYDLFLAAGYFKEVKKK